MERRELVQIAIGALLAGGMVAVLLLWDWSAIERAFDGRGRYPRFAMKTAGAYDPTNGSVAPVDLPLDSGK